MYILEAGSELAVLMEIVREGIAKDEAGWSAVDAVQLSNRLMQAVLQL